MPAADPAFFRRAMTESEKGVLFAVLAHFVWGGMAIYFYAIRHSSPVEIAASR